MTVGLRVETESVLNTDNMVSDLMSLTIVFPEDFDDFLLFRCIMLEGLLCREACWLSSNACIQSRSLALLFSMSFLTIGDVYVT